MTQKRGISFKWTSLNALKFLSRIDSICMVQDSRWITFSDSIPRAIRDLAVLAGHREENLAQEQAAFVIVGIQRQQGGAQDQFAIDRIEEIEALIIALEEIDCAKWFNSITKSRASDG